MNDFCNSLGGAQVTTWKVSQALERLEITREASLKEQRPAIDRSVFKYESIISTCVDVAMKITRDVVELQVCILKKIYIYILDNLICKNIF